MDEHLISNNNNPVDNIQHCILPKAIYCWKPTLDIFHPFIRHNRVELYYGSNYNSDLLDHNQVVDLLKYHLDILHEELRSDCIFPSYGQHHFHAISNQDKSLSLSVIFWCESDLFDYRFCDLINSHFEQISRPIEQGRLNRSDIVIVTSP
jgi:hypothetical protein